MSGGRLEAEFRTAPGDGPERRIALRGHVSGEHGGRSPQLIGVALVSDEQWALTMAEVAKGRGTAAYYFGAATSCYLTWLLSPLIGRLIGAAIDDPVKYGLDFAFTATFLALLFGLWKGKTDLVPWGVAALVAIAASMLITGNWYILLGGLAGSLAGAVVETFKVRRVA